jgi:hypothetical protein
MEPEDSLTYVYKSLSLGDIHTHTFYNINFNIILPFTFQIFRVCYKRHPSHLTELHAIKMYNLVYARNEIQKKSEANIGVTVMLIQWKP